jgi:hypothetical protein
MKTCLEYNLEEFREISAGSFYYDMTIMKKEFSHHRLALFTYFLINIYYSLFVRLDELLEIDVSNKISNNS